MAYPYHYLLNLSGEHTVAPEIWSMSIKIGGAGALDPVGDAEDMLSALETPIATRFSGGLGISNEARLTLIKLNLIGPDGKYVDQEVTHQREVSATGSGSFEMPLQVSTVVSFRTAALRGYANRGRVFIPYPTGSIANGRWTQSTVEGVALGWGLFLDDINAAVRSVNPNLSVSVVSGVGAGAQRAVTYVSVGDVPDTQRRRRNALDEVYTNETLS